jgi:hypothetical protein
MRRLQRIHYKIHCCNGVVKIITLKQHYAILHLGYVLFSSPLTLCYLHFTLLFPSYFLFFSILKTLFKKSNNIVVQTIVSLQPVNVNSSWLGVFSVSRSTLTSLFQVIADCCAKGDIRNFTNAVVEFDTISPLDPWKTSVLLKAKNLVKDQSIL